MADNCKSCHKVIGARAIKQRCSVCQHVFHASCVNLSKEDVEHINTSDFVWRCQPCQKAHRSSMRLEHAVETDTVTLEDIMDSIVAMRKDMSDMRKEQREREEALNKSLEECYMRIEEIKVDQASTNVAVESNASDIQKLQAENLSLKQKLKDMERQGEDNAQYSRLNSVEVFGVPEVPDENVIQTVQQIGNGLGFKIEPNMIDTCHRLSKLIDGRPRGIIIKFVRRIDKEEMLKRKRSMKNFSARDIGFSVSTPIYINESLSPGKRRLMKEARQVKRNTGFRYLWSSNGKILMKKNERSPVIVINCLEDLKNVQ